MNKKLVIVKCIRLPLLTFYHSTSIIRLLLFDSHYSTSIIRLLLFGFYYPTSTIRLLLFEAIVFELYLFAFTVDSTVLKAWAA
jgi:hypothetical protein